MADLVGQQLGNYRLLRLLGEGGFAEVYLGEHIHLGTHAAIKVLRTQLISDDVDKFRIEARTIARLIHPHIVRVLDFGVEGKTPFLVMDYAPHGTLRQRHPYRTRLPLDTIISYVKQVADALQYAHNQRLVHRDIKPENMLIGLRNEILLSDFGIAIISQSSRYQSAQDMAGTIAYMAPEQIQAHPRPASDQYSLGIVVYEWLSGDRPFHGSFTEIAIKHSVVLPPPLREKVPTISPVVERVVLTALAKDPKERFGSVQAFANALEQACQPMQGSQFILQGQSSLSTGLAIPPSHHIWPADVAATSNKPAQPGIMPTVPSVSRSSKRRFSQPIVLLILAGLLILGGSLTWLTILRPSGDSAVNHAPTATTQPSQTATPSPTSLLQVGPRPTLTTDCGHLVTPWVALYQYSNFGGRELCFEGTGIINLADFGFDKQTEAINIAANGEFFDQANGQGAQLTFYYGDEKADLGNWDNRISSFKVDS